MLADFFSDLRYRFRAVFQRSAVEQELDDEMRFHLERETQKNIQRGFDAGEAERRARIEFGGVDRFKEDARDVRGVRLLETILRDLRYAARGLRAHPGFTLAVVATLSLGIGANAAMFGVVDRLMFRAPAYLRDPGNVNRINLVYTFRGEPYTNGAIEYKRYLELLRASSTIAQGAAVYSDLMAVGAGESAREMKVAAVSASYFALFDAKPVLGRFFDSTEDVAPKGAPVVVIGNTLWKTRFGSRTDAIGQQLQIGPINATIVGVAPEGFVGTDQDEAVVAFIPITAYGATAFADYSDNYHWGWMN